MYSTGEMKGIELKSWIDLSTGHYDENKVYSLYEAMHSCVRDIVYYTREYKDSPAFWDDDLFSHGLRIRFSRDTHYLKSTGMSVNSIKKLLDEILKDMTDDALLELKDLLSRVHGVRDLRNNSDIRDVLPRIPQENEKCRRLQRDIGKKLIRVLGRFYPSKRHHELGEIVLYPVAIAESRLTRISGFDIVFWATFAHEVFHAYHYSAFVKNGITNHWNDKDDLSKSKTVKESMAAAFESEFISRCEYEGAFSRTGLAALAHERQLMWLEEDVLDWPYSGALGITSGTMPKSGLTRFTELIQRSINGWELPFEAILAGYYTARVQRLLP